MAEPILAAEGLTTSYGAVTALAGVDMRLPRGGICAVLGANGAGKTTLLRTLSGLKRADSGRVLLEGADITRLPPERHVRRGLVHVPEGGGVIVELSVAENLRLGGLWRSGRRERARLTEEVLELFPPLRERLARPAATLSGGERQMLALGRALMARPRVLLLDEPSLGLAPMVARQIMRMLLRLRGERELSVVLVEQNARSALSITDHGMVLNQGAVAVSDSADRLLADDRMRRAYLGF